MDAIFVYFCSVQFRFFYGYVQYSYNFTTSSMKILDVSFLKFIDMFVFLIFYLHFSHFHSNVGSMSTRILGVGVGGVGFVHGCIPAPIIVPKTQ